MLYNLSNNKIRLASLLSRIYILYFTKCYPGLSKCYPGLSILMINMTDVSLYFPTKIKEIMLKYTLTKIYLF